RHRHVGSSSSRVYPRTDSDRRRAVPVPVPVRTRDAASPSKGTCKRGGTPHDEPAALGHIACLGPEAMKKVTKCKLGINKAVVQLLTETQPGHANGASRGHMGCLSPTLSSTQSGACGQGSTQDFTVRCTTTRF